MTNVTRQVPVPQEVEMVNNTFRDIGAQEMGGPRVSGLYKPEITRTSRTKLGSKLPEGSVPVSERCTG